MDWSKFDEQVDLEQLKKDAEEAEQNGGFGDYREVPAGTYVGKIEKMEVGCTKDNRPMLKVQFRITEGEFEKSCLFMNRVLFGTKNDANMIASAVGWLKTLEPSDEVGPIVFESYGQFADLVLDIMEDIDGELEYEIEYDEKSFNNISIKEVFEV